MPSKSPAGAPSTLHGDTLYSVIDAYKEHLYTPSGGRHGVPWRSRQTMG